MKMRVVKIKIFADFETTGINPMCDEIITGYFLAENGEEYDFKSKVVNWSYEAQLIHKITEEEANTYPDRDVAFDGLLKWLPKEFELVCYANPLTSMGYFYFDNAILNMNMMDHLKLLRIEHLPFKTTTISVYDMVKNAYKNGYFKPIRSDRGRISFSQSNVYKALFLTDYEAHNAKEDVIAMKSIYDHIVKVDELGISINKNQLSLL